MLLIDASVYIFRAYHALPDSMVDPDGAPVNAVYGFADFLAGLLDSVRPSEIAVAFDESLETSFRNEFFPDYKANRETAPPELKAQIAACQVLVAHLGIVGLASPRFEADDLIGTLAVRAQASCTPITIVTADKDLTQLLTERDRLWDYARDRIYDTAAVHERFGVAPGQMADYLALVGDPVDNIPGVAGVGAKSAAALLAAFGDLDGVYSSLDQTAVLPVRGGARLADRLAAGRDAAFLSRRLAGIVTDAPLPEKADSLAWRGGEPAALHAWCDGLGMGDRLRGRLVGLERAA